MALLGGEESRGTTTATSTPPLSSAPASTMELTLATLYLLMRALDPQELTRKTSCMP